MSWSLFFCVLIACGLCFCAGIYGWSRMCLLMFRGLEAAQDQTHKDMKILQDQRAETNELADERNDILRMIRDYGLAQERNEKPQGGLDDE